MNKTMGLLLALMLMLCFASTASAASEERYTIIDGEIIPSKAEKERLNEYLELQASLPTVVKSSPYSSIMYSGTKERSRISIFKAIDDPRYCDLSELEKRQLKEDLLDIWDRYPDKIESKDDIPLANVRKILDKRTINREGLNAEMFRADSENTKVYSTEHQDFAFYACDGSAYDDYAKEAADDPDNGVIDPEPFYRYYNHYEDYLTGIGGADTRCDGFTDDAITYLDNNDQVNAHKNFGLSSHYLVDVGVPFHSKGGITQALQFSIPLFDGPNHAAYEGFISDNWESGFTFKNKVSGNSQSITVTNVDDAIDDAADYSSQFFDDINDEIDNNPDWDTDLTVAYCAQECTRQSAKYTHGLYDYIFV
jgi:hypothetical protein